MKSKIKHYIKEIVIFFIVITIFANAISLYKSMDLKKDQFNMTNITLLDNMPYKLKNDKPLLVHFWADWCPTCSIEASNIQRVSQYYEVLTIAVKSGTDENIKKYLQEKNLDFKVINDINAFIAREFNIAAYPTTFIYDKNKELVFSEVGYTSTFGLFVRMWWAGL